MSSWALNKVLSFSPSFYSSAFQKYPKTRHFGHRITSSGWSLVHTTVRGIQEEYEEISDVRFDIEDSLTPLPKRRPTWTWDWELPKLTTLKLSGELAYRFHFMMLSGTPSLNSLAIDFGSWKGIHEQFFSLADLIKPGFQRAEMNRFLKEEQHWPEAKEKQQLLGASSSESDGTPNITDNDHDNGKCYDAAYDKRKEVWREFQYLHVLALVVLRLQGLWHVDVRVLEVLFWQDCAWCQGISYAVL